MDDYPEFRCVRRAAVALNYPLIYELRSAPWDYFSGKTRLMAGRGIFTNHIRSDWRLPGSFASEILARVASDSRVLEQYDLVTLVQEHVDDTELMRLIAGNWSVAALESSWTTLVAINSTVSEGRHLAAVQRLYRFELPAKLTIPIEYIEQDRFIELLRTSWRLAVEDELLDWEAKGFPDIEMPGSGNLLRHDYKEDRCRRCGVTVEEQLDWYRNCTSNAELAQLRRAAAARFEAHEASRIAEDNAQNLESAQQQPAATSETAAVDDTVPAKANESITFKWGGFVEDEEIEIEESLILDPEAKTVALNRFRKDPVVVQMDHVPLKVRTLQGSKLSWPVDEFRNRSWMRRYDYVPGHEPYEVVHQIIVDDGDYDKVSALLRPIGHFPNMHVTMIGTGKSGAFRYMSPNTKIQFLRERDMEDA